MRYYLTLKKNHHKSEVMKTVSQLWALVEHLTLCVCVCNRSEWAVTSETIRNTPLFALAWPSATLHQPHTHALQMGNDITVIVLVVEFIWIYCDYTETDINIDMMMCLDSIALTVWRKCLSKGHRKSGQSDMIDDSETLEKKYRKSPASLQKYQYLICLHA